MLKQPIHVCEDSDLTNLESDICTFRRSVHVDHGSTSDDRETQRIDVQKLHLCGERRERQ